MASPILFFPNRANFIDYSLVMSKLPKVPLLGDISVPPIADATRLLISKLSKRRDLDKTKKSYILIRLRAQLIKYCRPISELNDHIMILGSFVFLLVAAVLYIFPPKEINSIYGYRTPGSKKSIRHWNFANKLASKIMLYFAVPAFLASLTLDYLKLPNMEIIASSLIILGILVAIIITEVRLKRI